MVNAKIFSILDKNALIDLLKKKILVFSWLWVKDSHVHLVMDI